MTWLQFILLLLFIGAGLEVTFRRVKRLVEVKGHHEQALDALTGQHNQLKDRVEGVVGRVNEIERHLGFHA